MRDILYLTGVDNARTQAIAAGGADLGVLCQPKSFGSSKARLYPAGWAADNGCFSSLGFDEGNWWSWLKRQSRDGCLFATAPDVVGDAGATLIRSARWLSRIRTAGFPVAYVAQNGATPTTLPWRMFDVLFLGGSMECLPCGYVRPADDHTTKRCPSCNTRLAEWKESEMAATLTADAKSRGMWVHMGRVNSLTRLLLARSFGCDSADGTYARFHPDNPAVIAGWLAHIATLPSRSEPVAA